MKILITGITGLFGSYLAKTFLPLGEIHGLKRAESKLDLLAEINEQIHWHEGDINDYQSMEEAFEGMDVVIHSAGMVSFRNGDEEKLLKVNVEGTANVVNVMLGQGIKKLIHVSSVAAIGRNPEKLLMDEREKWVTSDLNTPYAISKYLGELEAWRGAQEGLDVIVVNPSVLLGKVDDNRSSTAIYEYVLQEKKFFPKGNVNYIDVRDAAEITAELFQKNAWGERFILNKEGISYAEFFKSTAEVLDRKAPKWPVPSRLIRFADYFFKIKGLFTQNAPSFSKKAVRAAQFPIVFNNVKVGKLLNFRYTPLKETLEWARSERKQLG
ncbi:NAD-dependent epimerase/dehydratase family protein [Litoribacter alkaliphilus]|uniref:NAD-dependent epimerase/dehydratase family protein n=1 Tax=Litoribacter ruber TaxID=702568 RepID=A0AAP2CJJ5_9BACT|nr:NAD-dependent epimerase/dehydratase family protein [Litoribacter alkaliphilus]MBS9525347.1 NAD-dependent epimerase/dehydratase family protein [Litoribacter alkaliphilus]